ncbi:hypothetical protein D3C85_1548250 [compost metagenome]
MSLVQWRNSMNGPPVVFGARNVPKKPVIWYGEIWLILPGTPPIKDTRQWRSKNPITRQDAQAVLAAMLDDLVAEHGNDAAIDSGFWMRSR